MKGPVEALEKGNFGFYDLITSNVVASGRVPSGAEYCRKCLAA